MTVSVPERRKVELRLLFKYVLSVTEVPLEVLQSLAGTLNWLRNAAPNLHSAFGAVRNALKEFGGACSTALLPAVARSELDFFSTFSDGWDGSTFSQSARSSC
jgi:hypothetical protein